MTWIDQVIEAVEHQIPDEEGPVPDRRAIAPAVQVEPGWYKVSTRNRPVRIENYTDLKLAAETAERTDSYRVIAAVEGHEEIRVQVGRHAPDSGLSLFGTPRLPGFLPKSLRDALSRAPRRSLADDVAAGRAGAIPDAVPEVAGLTPEQRCAHHACVAPGVHLVWGPPGTGKTTVLGRAIDDLLNTGARVLLVSGTNIAVDNALESALTLREHEPGELLRVGTPQLPRIATDDRVSLTRIVAARLKELTEQRDRLETQLVELGDHSVLRRFFELDEQVDDAEIDNYYAAQSRIEAGRRIDSCATAVRNAETSVQSANEQFDTNRKAAEAAAEAVEQVQAQLRHRRIANDLAHRFKQLSDAVEHAQRDRVTINARRQRLAEDISATGSSLFARIWRRRTLRRLHQDKDAADHESAAATLRLRSAEEEQRNQLTELHPKYAEHDRLAGNADANMLERLRLRLSTAQTASDEARRIAGDAERHLQRCEAELRTASQAEREAEHDFRLVRDVQQNGLLARYEEREELRDDAIDIDQRRTELAAEHDELLGRLEDEQANAQPKVIREARLVATTLTRFHINSTVAEGPYDVVLVDEAAAAPLPEILLAATAAKRTVTLLGDFCQLGPIRPKSLPDDTNVARWSTRDCFELFGITTPDAASAHDGCVCLRRTHRFGPRMVELANRIAYGHHLRTANGTQQDTEVVLMTTDELDDMASVKTAPTMNGRWWAAGSVLAHALAEHHLGAGETVGVVTPYKIQQQATYEYLRDRGLDRNVEVGTAHSFQGREFDVVIFDTVESGYESQGWVAAGNMRGNDYARTGARLLNVGLSRVKHRVYLLAGWKAITSAQSGTALAAVRETFDQLQLKGVRAFKFLGVDEQERPEKLDAIDEDVWNAFDEHVHVTAHGWYDEHSYYPAVLEEIDRAEHSIYMWSPWVHKRMESVLPQLHAASQRGVDVRVFISDEGDINDRKDDEAAERLDRLESSVTRMVRMRNMHQKIVVIDKMTVFLGSQNTLSSSPQKPRREIMVQHRGGRYAAKILEHQHADVLSDPPDCDHCDVRMEVYRSQSQRSDEWLFVCPVERRRHRKPITRGSTAPKAGTTCSRRRPR